MNFYTLYSPVREKRGKFFKTLLVMKMATFIICAAFLQVSAARSFAQRVTLTENNAPLGKIFDAIKRQTGYIFFYEDKALAGTANISINLKNVALKEALDLCLKDQPLIYTIAGHTIGVKRRTETPFRSLSTAVPITVSGKVTDTTGTALPGATIKISGQNNSFITASDGTFSFTAETGDKVAISFIGYKPASFIVTDDTPIVVILHLASGKLEEVVVSTGYQTLPKERATGSFSIVSKELYGQQVGTDILSRLEYIANGVSVFRNNATRTSQLMVRGSSTINGPSGPLVVVDNFPYEGDINNLNPNDVESVTILKDAAAASIWGTKAGNGVIVITTKKGKYGQPLQIDLNASTTVGNKPNLNYLTPMSGTDYIGFEQDLYNKGYYNGRITSTDHPALSPVIQLLANAANGTITPGQANAQITSLKNNDVRNDFSKYNYQRSVNQQYHLSFKGGNDRLTYLFSTGYDKDINALAAEFDRLNLRSESSFRPAKGLQLTAGLVYTSSNARTGRPAYGDIDPLQPYQMLADANGNALPIAQTYSQAFKDNAVKNGQLLDWNYYPLTDYQHDHTTTATQDILADFGAQYRLIKGLNIDIKYQYEKQQVNAGTIYDAQSYYARNLVNSFTEISGTTVANIIPVGGILDQQNSMLTSHDLRGQLNFSREWGDHAFSLIAGEELRTIRNDANTSRDYGYDNNILTTSPVDYINYYPNLATQQNGNIPYINALAQTQNRFVSFYTNGAYTYAAKYTISGSLRRDGSNLFGVETNDKWTPLWSSGLSWDLSRENFYHVDALPYIKIRATYGYSGNVDPGKAAVTTISYTGTSIYTNTPYSEVSNFANPDLRWEKVRTINLGVDLRSKNGRIYGSLDYYLKNSTDLYATVPVDYTAGLNIAAITKNVASMKGKGLDVELNSINLNGAFLWLTTLNLNYYRDKVTSYYLTTPNGNRYVLDNKNPVAGYPVWSVFSYRSAGLDASGNPQGYLNGKISEDYPAITGSGTHVSDLVYNGPRFPAWYGTLGNTVSYKGATLTARIAYNFGNYFRRQSINYSGLATTGAGNADYAKRWKKPGDENLTTVPSLVYPLNPARDDFYNASASLVEKADCIRLQYITIAYDLTNKQFPWLPFKSMQLYINANNVGILWRANKLGIDPDYTYTNSATPNPGTIALGLKANL